ncbi:MAG: hypothetical protein OXC91_00835 [Rhodobacteraceae bacterium]|nr:hypothetical protein [Paracoccaceae bacterium]
MTTDTTLLSCCLAKLDIECESWTLHWARGKHVMNCTTKVGRKNFSVSGATSAEAIRKATALLSPIKSICA